MRKEEVRNIKHAMAYLLDCTLATVDDIAMKKKKPVGEYKRQISIAQTHLDWCKEFGVDVSSTRGYEVNEQHGGLVAAYAQDISDRFNS